ncbi:MAG TPA: beta family protein, partial [Acidobacteriaceae bacterium]
SRTLEEHLDALFSRTKQAFQSNPFYLDFAWIEKINDRRAKGIGIEKLASLDLSFSLIVTPTDSSDLLRHVGDIVRSKRLSVAIRLRVENFNEDSDLDAEIDRIMESIGSDSASTDLIIDLQDIGHDLDRATLVARSIFSQVPRKEMWRRFILVASSFPEDLSDIDAASIQKLPRLEWNLWTRLQHKRAALPRLDLIFGDYAISNPTQKELDPRTMRMSANIRYTTPDDWLIVKGRNVRKYGFDQYFDLCRILIERPEYSGRDFSAGDKYISDCAEAQKGPGNATTWRRVGVNHHLTLMVEQLANNQIEP